MRAVLGLLAAMMVLGPAAARAAWQEASSDHFLVYGDLPDKELRDQAEALERFDRAIRYMLRMPDDPAARANRVRVYMVSGVGAMQRLCGRCNGQNVAGFYHPRAGASVAVMPRRNGQGQFDLRAQEIMQHEYTHAMMFENSNMVYPAWYAEGFAELAATAHANKDGSYAFGEAPLYRLPGLVLGAPMSMAALLAPKREPRGEDCDIFYGRAWLLTHYLSSDEARGKQLIDYLGRFNRGEPSITAATAAFGDINKLGLKLDGYLRSGRLAYWSIAAGKLTPGAISLRPLSPGETAFMPIRLRSTVGVGHDQALALVAPARQAAAAFAQDGVVQGWLAEVEYDAGNDKEAEAAADRALAIDPKSLQALLYKGRTHVRRAMRNQVTDAAAWREARSWFARANHDGPDRAQPLVLYYQSFRAAHVKPTDNAVAGLKRAFELAPQDTGLRSMVAAQDIRDGKLDEARTVLRPLAYDPHAKPDNPAAALLAALDQADGKAAQAMLDKLLADDDSGKASQ